MRQYRLFYKRGKAANFTAIQPTGGQHDKLIDHQQIRDAVAHMRLNPVVEGMSLRIDGNELFNIIAFDQEAEAPMAFKFEPLTAEEAAALAPPAIEPCEAPKVQAPTITGPDLRVTHYADGRVEVTPLNTFNGKTVEELRAEKDNFAAIYGADPAQVPVDGDTANDGLVNQ